MNVASKGGFATACNLFSALNCAIEHDDVIAVGNCVGKILESTANETDLFPANCYEKTLIFTIKKGNSFVFEHVSALGVARLSFFTMEHALPILRALRVNRDTGTQDRFLWFLDNSAQNAQISLLIAACLSGPKYLIDRICDDEAYINLRHLLATVASQAGFMDVVWLIVQAFPQVLPEVITNLSACPPQTKQGQSWINIHEFYAVWKAQQEHERLTMEVAGLDKHRIARKM